LNLIEYREGSNLLLNDEFEKDLVQGEGEAYGMEFLVKRDEGRINGWVGYTLAWSWRDFPDLNEGLRFPAKYDRRHDFSFVMNVEISKRVTFSSVWVYSSGSKFTAQIGQYLLPNPTLTGIDIIPIYTRRNEVSMSPSHRLDVNFTIKNKLHKRLRSEWQFGCYNLYNQTTPYRVRTVPTEDGMGYKYEQPGLFGFIPSVAWNFKF